MIIGFITTLFLLWAFLWAVKLYMGWVRDGFRLIGGIIRFLSGKGSSGFDPALRAKGTPKWILEQRRLSEKR